MTFRFEPAPPNPRCLLLSASVPPGKEVSERSSSILLPAKDFFLLYHLPQAFSSIINQVCMNMHKSLSLGFIKLKRNKNKFYVTVEKRSDSYS